MAVDAVSIKDLTIQFAKFFSNKDADSIGMLLADDFSLFDPSLQWLHGKETVLNMLKKQFDEITTIAYEVVNAFQDGNISILEFKISLDDLVLYGVDFMEWENGKMVELRCYYNPPNPSSLLA